MKKSSKAKKKNRRRKVRNKSSNTASLQSKVVDSSVVEDNDLTKLMSNEKKKFALLDSEDFVSIEQAKEYWLLSEWEKLATFDFEFLRRHPDRAEFMLLVGGAYLQLGYLEKGKRYTRLALEWGCSRHDMEKILVTGIYNTLGKIKKLTLNNDVFSLVNKCMAAEDIHDEVDKYLISNLLDNQSKLKFCIALSDRFRGEKDNLMALHFLTTAEYFLTREIDKELLVKKWLLSERENEAFDLLVKGSLKVGNFTKKETKNLLNVFNRVRKKEIEKGEHGHHLLLEYLNQNLSEYKKIIGNRVPTLIEIGTTRENVPGQGSTGKISKFCKEKNIQFITVDMDIHNINMAYNLFTEMGVAFDAVNSKGEDYLRSYAGYMDFVFLDAYDFDHGNHSAFRQSRYEKFLGSRIDEKKCHQMHLECAESVAEKLQPHGIVSIDDTWLVDEKWCAKGTLAVPYLLKNGFEIIVAKNRSVLMKRIKN